MFPTHQAIYSTKAGELTNARRISEHRIYEFVSRVIAAPRRPFGSGAVTILGQPARAVLALYLNIFVAVVQAFQKVPTLHALAPSGSEPPFAATQSVVLAILFGLGAAVAKRLHAQDSIDSGRTQ